MKEINEIFKKDSIFTVISISDWMACTTKRMVKATGLFSNGLPVFKDAKKGARKLYTIPSLFNSGTMIFAGEIPFKIDSEVKSTREGFGGVFETTTMRGNACYNFVGDPVVIKDYIRTKNLNETFSKLDAVVWIEGENEVPLFPEMETSHAVVQKIRAAHMERGAELKSELDKAKASLCPACKENQLDPIEVRNALSRYRDEYICGPCGTREAFEGDFWGSKVAETVAAQ